MISVRYYVDGVEVDYEDFHQARVNNLRNGRLELYLLDTDCTCMECGRKVPIWCATCDCEYSDEYDYSYELELERERNAVRYN